MFEKTFGAAEVNIKSNSQFSHSEKNPTFLMGDRNRNPVIMRQLEAWEAQDKIAIYFGYCL